MWGLKLTDMIGTLLFVRSARVMTLGGIIVFFVLLFIAGLWGHIPVEWMQEKGWLSKDLDSNNPLLSLYLLGTLGLTTTVSLFLIAAFFVVIMLAVLVIAVVTVQNKKARLINKIKLIEQDKMQKWPRAHMNVHLKKYWLQWEPTKKEQW